MSIPRTIIDKSNLPAPLLRPSLTREEWLEQALEGVKCYFEVLELVLPPVKLSCSWPGGGSPRKRLGECWAVRMSTAGHNEIFISPVLDDSAHVLAVLIHELVHAVDDCANGHKGPFARMARSLGLVGKLTSTQAGPELAVSLSELAEILGPYPHKRMVLKDGAEKKTGSTTTKFTCEECEAAEGPFVFRVSNRMLAKLGDTTLSCPACGSDIPLQ